MVREPAVIGYGHWVEPELRDKLFPLCMNMRWFCAVGTKKHERIRTNSENCRHESRSMCVPKVVVLAIVTSLNH
jgi:hypothetical protein